MTAEEAGTVVVTGASTGIGAACAQHLDERVFHALTAKRPRTRYLVGRDARLYVRLAQICPDRIIDWVTRKVMGLG